MDTAPATHPAPERHSRWRLIAAVLLGLMVVLALVLAWSSGPDSQLKAFTKRGYPTTLAGLETWIPAPPPEENSAALFLDAADEIRAPKGKMVPSVGTGDFSRVRGQPWPQDVLKDTREYVADNAGVFERIPKFTAAGRVRFPVAYTNGSNLNLKHELSLKKLAQALTVRAELDAEEGRGHAATEAILAAIGVCKTLDDEPILISKLVQIACEAIASQTVERVLNRTTLDERDLAALQAAFAQRVSTNRFEQSLVGELCLGLEGYRANPTTMAASMNWMAALSGGPTTPSATQVLYWSVYKGCGLHLADRAAYLRYMEELYDISRRPFADRSRLIGAWSARMLKECSDWYRPRALCNLSLTSFSSAAERDLVSQARAMCTAAALAVERHRRAHGGTLPGSLDALVPHFLAAVPLDPIDGKPLRFKPLEHGYVVYSIGEDGTDDGGRERARGAASKASDVTVILAR